ncbi:MAG: peptidoglycan-associated lipoprotein Pal [Burkholderiaceae bacterium]|jgi:peptidoglycan-associated lipoprotein|nr:peptidoglycan-associated lipoprotein Pal [Burkholderiaceae bacterium]
MTVQNHRTHLAGLAFALLLTACGTGVKLDEGAPVEDRTGTAVTGVPSGQPSSGAEAGRTSPTPPSTSQGTQVAPVTVTPSPTEPASPVGANLVFFDYDSFVIKPEFQLVVDAHARYLRANPGKRAVVEGHTDERGGREYNVALGQKRAEAVQRALGILGVESARVEAISFGKEKPAQAGQDEAAHARNRRAVIVVR